MMVSSPEKLYIFFSKIMWSPCFVRVSSIRSEEDCLNCVSLFSLPLLTFCPSSQPHRQSSIISAHISTMPKGVWWGCWEGYINEMMGIFVRETFNSFDHGDPANHNPTSHHHQLWPWFLEKIKNPFWQKPNFFTSRRHFETVRKGKMMHIPKKVLHG